MLHTYSVYQASHCSALRVCKILHPSVLGGFSMEIKIEIRYIPHKIARDLHNSKHRKLRKRKLRGRKLRGQGVPIIMK